MEEERGLQEVNITDLWNKNLYESIQRLQDFERICRDGAVSITEYLQVDASRRTEIQFQYLRMMISELVILLGNARARLSKEFFLKAKIQLRRVKNVIDLNPHKIFVSSHNQQNNTSQHYLSNEFYSYLYDLTLIREGIVSELQDILFGTSLEKSESMEKTQEVYRQ